MIITLTKTPLETHRIKTLIREELWELLMSRSEFLHSR